ncbi:MAG TPA: glycosyltransferase family 2 protein, partial [Roseobacter sp.]|nr:glycosyltransferase family 2 protein [Roseobacter sp.]
FMMIEAESGEVGLRAFFDEVCADTPQLRDRLEAHGLLREINLHLPEHLATHFPEFTGL